MLSRPALAGLRVSVLHAIPTYNAPQSAAAYLSERAWNRCEEVVVFERCPVASFAGRLPRAVHCPSLHFTATAALRHLCKGETAVARAVECGAASGMPSGRLRTSTGSTVALALLAFLTGIKHSFAAALEIT